MTTEMVLYLLAFGIALFLRLWKLGGFPLSEFEAEWAVRAFDLTIGETGSLGPQPAYIILTSLIFSIFKDSEATARLLPALAGSCLVFLPWLLRGILGSSSQIRRASLMFAFAVALDPGLVYVSRIAGSPILPLVFSLFAGAFIWQGNPIAAGILAGLAGLSGPGVIEGLTGLGIALLTTMIFQQMGIEIFGINSEYPLHLTDRNFWRKFGLFAGGTIILGGLLWLNLPQGFASLSNTIPAYLNGWINGSGVPALRLPATLVLYQPLAVIFGLIAILHTWRKPLTESNPNRLLSLWFASALILYMIYPGRQVSSLIWVLVPLWFLAVSELSRHTFTLEDASIQLPGFGLSGAISFFLFLIWYNLLRLEVLGAQNYLYAAIIGGLFLMALIVTILVELGWGSKAVWFGLTWGISLIAGLYMLSAMWGVSQVRPNHPSELWTYSPGTGQVIDLMQTLDIISSREYGIKNNLDIHNTLSSPGLRWMLRKYPNVSYSSTIGYDMQPDVILTNQPQNETGLQAGYRGQELMWSQTALWNGVIPPNLLRWLTYRELPTTPQPITVWVRGDLFPGEFSSSSQNNLVPEEFVP